MERRQIEMQVQNRGKSRRAERWWNRVRRCAVRHAAGRSVEPGAAPQTRGCRASRRFVAMLRVVRPYGASGRWWRVHAAHYAARAFERATGGGPEKAKEREAGRQVREV